LEQRAEELGLDIELTDETVERIMDADAEYNDAMYDTSRDD